MYPIPPVTRTFTFASPLLLLNARLVADDWLSLINQSPAKRRPLLNWLKVYQPTSVQIRDRIQSCVNVSTKETETPIFRMYLVNVVDLIGE
jgi:hypothetical protein